VIDISKKEEYKTVAREGSAVIVEKKSKFIATVKPVDNEEDAIAFVSSVKAKYPDARHNVYAYIIDENNIFRYSDDGEPQGTAGMPVLDTMRKDGIVDTAIVVTRYFGGILLGTGGLVHAYGATAREGLLDAGIVMRTLCDVVAVKVDYTLSGRVQYILSAGDCLIEDTVYDNEVTYRVCVKCAQTERFIAKITDETNARAVCEILDKKYVDLQ
jgi:uncharacterized YigZ family protein